MPEGKFLESEHGEHQMKSNEQRNALLRALDKGQYEETESGVLLTRQGIMASGMYVHDVNGLDERSDSNLITAEGLNYMLDVALKDGTKLASWYVAISSGNVSPVGTWTAANYTANATEITSNSTGYAETTRPAYTPGTISSGSVDNTASRAAFTVELPSGTLTVWGAAILSSNVKGGTAGKLLSATKFSASRTLYDADVLNIGYTLTLTST